MIPHPDSMLMPVEQMVLQSVAMHAVARTDPSPARALEIGTGYGGTAVILAEAGMSVVTCDHFQAGNYGRARDALAGRVVSEVVYASIGLPYGDDPVAFTRQQLIRPLAGGEVLIAHLPSRVVLPILTAARRTYELVLFDGNHEEDVDADLRDAALLVAPGGVLAIDDVANGHPAVTEALLRFLSEQAAGAWQIDFIQTFAELCSSHHRFSKLVVLTKVGR